MVEFVNLIMEAVTITQSVDHLWKCGKVVYKRDKKGSMNSEQTRLFVQEVIDLLGADYKIPQSLYDKLYKEVDEDGSGSIDKKEMAMFTKRLMEEYHKVK